MSSYITANVYRLKLNTTFNSNWENLRMSPKKGILIFGIPLKKNTRFSQKFGFLLIFFFRNSEFYSKKKFRFRNSGKSEFMTEPLVVMQNLEFYIIKQESFFGQNNYLKIEEFLKIFNFKVNSQTLKSAPNAYKLLSNILAIELNYI